MGLDVTSWSHVRELTPAERIAMPTGDIPSPFDWWTTTHGDSSSLRKPWTEFPAAADHLAALDYFVAEGIPYDFRAGSYSGYGDWREHLAALVGITDLTVWWSCHQPGSFAELLNNSDCESTIGPLSCAKLAADFDQWRDRAATFAATLGDRGTHGYGTYWLAKYESWRTAFHHAAHTGCVVLH